MKLSITTEIDLPDELPSYQAAEAKIEEAVRASGQALVVQVLALKEARIAARKSVRVKDRREKGYQTLLGEVGYARYRVYDRKRGRLCYPLDEWMGLVGRERATPGLSAAIATAAVERSYRQASREVERRTGVKRTAMSNWRLVQAVAARERVREARERPVSHWKHKPLPGISRQMKENPCPILAIDPDGTYCRHQKKAGKDHDVKIAVLYTGKKATDRTGKRLSLCNKRVLFSRTDESVDAFFNRVTHTALSYYGANAGTAVVIHGDGDPWIKRLKHDFFPNALIRLDPWHLKKKIVQATGDKRIPERWEHNIYGYPDALMTNLEGFKLHRTAPRSKKRQAVDDLIAYVKNNKDGLLPSGQRPEWKQQHPGMYKRGSGTIESNVGHAFGARFKQPRMSWSAKGLDNLAFLRERHLNGHLKPKFRVPVPITRQQIAELTGRVLH